VTEACSVLAERLGEDLAGTAPKARRFLLLEQPGPWTGRNAVTHSDLDVGLARELLAWADEAGLKAHLIRRTSRRTALERRVCFVADTSGPTLRRFELRDPAEVLSLDLAAGEQAGPLYAVCTHGKRDPCCARRGRPLARAVRAARPEETWEIGHIGGHRFAATFLAFPHGLCFGRVPAARGPEIVAGLEAGEIALEHFRGRAGEPPVAQAADVLVRRQLGLRGVDDVAIESVDGAHVTLRTAAGRLRAVVARHEADPRPISCGDEPEAVPAYALTDLVALDRAA
jgi:Sucrase/ferredoxin-like